MKISVVSFTLLLFAFVFKSKGQTISITRDTLHSDVPVVTNLVADSALKVASYLFNSKEFRDTISKLIFPSSNICNGCGSSPDDPNKKVTGQEVLTKLFNRKSVKLKLTLDKKV